MMIQIIQIQILLASKDREMYMMTANERKKAYVKDGSKRPLRVDNSGSALFVVIIVIAVLIIFAFSLLLVSYTLYASQNKRAASLRCSEAANSFSSALKGEMEDPEAYKNSWFWMYLRYNLYQNSNVTWPYYDPEKTGHTAEYAYRYFKVKPNANYDVEGFPGEIELCMYWTLPEDSVLEDDELYEASIDDKNGAHLCVDITCSSGSQSYSIQDKYLINVVGFTSDAEDQEEKDAIKDEEANTLKNPLGNYIKGTEKWSFVYEDHKSE